MGNEAAELSQFKSSYEYFEKSLKTDSTFSITYLNYGVALNKNKEFNKAIKTYNRGLTYELDSERKGYFFYNIENVYYKMNDFQNSNKFNNKALDLVKDKDVQEDNLELRNVIAE